MFKPQFAPLVKSGVKRQTVRPIPKRIPAIGDHESWREWSGLPYRSKQRELAQVELTSVEPIIITETHIIIPGCKTCSLTRFAKADGFKNWYWMKHWFKNTHGLPFTGILIKSKDLNPQLKICVHPVPSVVKP